MKTRLLLVMICEIYAGWFSSWFFKFVTSVILVYQVGDVFKILVQHWKKSHGWGLVVRISQCTAIFITTCLSIFTFNLHLQSTTTSILYWQSFRYSGLYSSLKVTPICLPAIFIWTDVAYCQGIITHTRPDCCKTNTKTPLCFYVHQTQ